MDLFDYSGALHLEESAALETDVFIADAEDVETYPALPDLSGGTKNSDYVDLADATFTMKTGKSFTSFRPHWRGIHLKAHWKDPEVLSHL